MWTNVFKIGGLHHISWFQCIPSESSITCLSNERPDNSKAEQDLASWLVLSSHLQLQKAGFLSTWTNSFVGPWDPSQGLHNPDEKIKLWLFLPGQHSSVVESAQAAISKLRVVSSGVWLAPGDSEEVAVALSQSLRNRIERSLSRLSYMRFGDVFSKYLPSQSDVIFRRGQPTVEFIFAATEETIFVHVVICAKKISSISCCDLEKLMKHSSRNASYRLPVVVSPHGMRGWLTGCCSNDVVDEVYLSSGKFVASSGLAGLPFHVSQGPGCRSKGKHCYVEVKLGCSRHESDKISNSCLSSKRNLPKNHSLLRKTFVYPVEAIVVPSLPVSQSRSSLKRFWMQEWIGPSLPSSSFFMHCTDKYNMGEMWVDSFEKQIWHDNDSSSSSSNSSSSSISGSSSDNDHLMSIEAGDFEAEADSLSCRQSVLSFNEVRENDGSKLHARVQISEPFKSNLVSGQIASSVVSGAAREQTRYHWCWDDEDGDVVMDIHALLSEFGDFGDFFENDDLPFGEPPGTAESQTLVFSTPDGGQGCGSPAGLVDGPDQALLPAGFTSADDSTTRAQEEGGFGAVKSGPSNLFPRSPPIEPDDFLKAEALLAFAPEYGAVETAVADLRLPIFRSPYCPKSQKIASSNSSPNSYAYDASAPSICFDPMDDSTGKPADLEACQRKELRNCYTYVETGREKPDSSRPYYADNQGRCTRGVPGGGMPEMEGTLLSMETVLATDLECSSFQASMCKARHLCLLSDFPAPVCSGRLGGSVALSHFPCDVSTVTDSVSSDFSMKKESIPVRIAGGADGVREDGHVSAPVGVWRPVEPAKVAKPAADGAAHVGGQKQSLQDLLDAVPLLVQQAASFVDLALDGGSGDGPFALLALQEHWRCGFSCGPSMAHAACGGILASCHSLDVSGVELVDPLSADIHASCVISLLNSDIKMALKYAFGNVEGPLSVLNWCRRHGHSSNDAGDGLYVDSLSEYQDSSITASLSVEESINPTHSSACGSSYLKAKIEETSQKRLYSETEFEKLQCTSPRPTIFVLPPPMMLVGYQDDWLKTSANSLQRWEKAPFEPYASPKPISYFVVCPDIDPLTCAAADFFIQLGAVYEACQLGTHSPLNSGNHEAVDSIRWASCGFVLLDCPKALKRETIDKSFMGSASDYFLSLSDHWDFGSYLKSISKALKAIRCDRCSSTKPKEGNGSPCIVIYVVCPFPEPIAILRTLVESSVAIGSVMNPCDSSRDRERRCSLQNQIERAFSCPISLDEKSKSNIPMLCGFSVPKLVLQILPVDVIFRIASPVSELVVLKETAFNVYNKIRRISKGSSSIILSGKPLSVAAQISSLPSVWKDCVGSRIGAACLPREGETNRLGDRDAHLHDDETRYMFEPLYILSDPGSVDQAAVPEFSGNVAAEASKDASFLDPFGSQLDGSEADRFASGHQKTLPGIHCCYGWTEDWCWLACIWTDARGELLDCHVFPFEGVSVRQDTKGLELLFAQVLQQGCNILQACSSSDVGAAKARDFVISRIGSFFELEYQVWQKAISSIVGSEMKKWPLQLRGLKPDSLPPHGNSVPLQQQEMSLMQERAALPSSPNLLYASHSKASGYVKSSLVQSASRKLPMVGQQIAIAPQGVVRWIQSICFAAVSVDQSIQLICPDSSSSSSGDNGTSTSGYVEGYTPVKSLGSTSASYIFIPSPGMRFLPSTTPLQLPTCLTSESPPLAHLLHSKGSAVPLATSFVVSKAVPSMRRDCSSNFGEEWPSILAVNLIDYYGSSKKQGGGAGGGFDMKLEPKEFEFETRLILDSVAAELHALSWLTVSPAYPDRRTALPFHCDMLLRLRRLLHFAHNELSSRRDQPSTSCCVK